MWAGTYKNGFNYYHESIFKFQTIRYPLELMRDIFNNDFNCIVEDKEGDLWIGTSGNGLLRYDRETGEYVRYRAGRESENAISGDVVISMAKDLDGKLWLGTYMEGLTGFDGKRFKHYRISRAVRTAYPIIACIVCMSMPRIVCGSARWKAAWIAWINLPGNGRIIVWGIRRMRLTRISYIAFPGMRRGILSLELL